MNKLPYYWVNPKNQRAYWKPNRRMMESGFSCVPLGDAGPDAEKRASLWTKRFRASRQKGESARLTRKPEIDDVQFVYFMQLGDRVKIGTSRKPWGRLQSIAGSMPGRLNRLVVVVGTARDEKRLHDRFAKSRDNGEWFVASKALLRTIGRCAVAGQVIHESNPGTNPGGGVESFPQTSQINRQGA